ncbi:MAG: alpha/beta fold hydrolase [Spirochaetia bacterium]
MELQQGSYTMRDGKKVVVYTAGNNNDVPILMIHGLGADHCMWTPQLMSYPEKGVFCIAPDVRGHGKSEPVEDLSLTDWAKDLNEILDTMGIEKVHVLGVSMGGVIAQEFALQYPEKISSLVLCDTFGKLRTMTEKFLGWAIKISYAFFKKMPRKKMANLLGKGYAFPGGEEGQAYFKEAAYRMDLDQVTQARKVINKVDTEDRLAELDVPSLVMVGDRGGAFFVKMSKRLAQNLNTSLIVIPGSLDPSNLTGKEYYDKNVLKFIANQKDER